MGEVTAAEQLYVEAEAELAIKEMRHWPLYRTTEFAAAFDTIN